MGILAYDFATVKLNQVKQDYISDKGENTVRVGYQVLVRRHL